jgi:chromosome segregation protein
MHLHSLELFGFKSFADKTIFNFHQGVTAVVGPNGCGKSNLLDAVRWTLGEQSAKSLRGDEMADVIFNGADTRNPLGFAEVSLTFTDCGSELDVDWHEVRVTRRVYRDGKSEYLLNKTPCRLRDIQNLFADTGVARAAYSMMEQGKIDMILSSRPEDRRSVFEEAAGITKYKAQKREALRKLEATEANLLRIGDIIKEVKRQIGSLQRQAGKARRYQALLADLRTLDTHHSREQLESLQADLACSQAEIARVSESEQATRAKVDLSENHLAGQRLALEEIDKQIADGRTELQQLQSEIGINRSRIELNRQLSQELSELIERSRKDISAADAKLTRQQKELRESDALIENMGVAVQAKQVELTKLTDLIAQLRTERIACDAELEKRQEVLFGNERRIAKFEEEISAIAVRREATHENLRDLEAEISATTAARDRVQSEMAAERASIASARENLDLLKATAEAGEEKLQQHQFLLEDAEGSLVALERALAEKESRLEILRQLNEQGEGLAQGSQAVLRGLDDPTRIQPALAGALFATIDVDPKFTAAIEAALGRNLQAVVLREAGLTSEIVATLTKKKLGQAALAVPKFCPSVPATQPVPLPQNALAWGIDKVNAPESLTTLLSRLLQGVAIFPNLDEALIFKQDGSPLAAATLSGEFISPDGIVFTGSGDTRSASLLERKAQISLLAGEHSALSAQREMLRRKRDDAKTRVEKAAHDFDSARAELEKADRAQSSSENRILFLERELGEAEREIEDLRSEQATLVKQIQVADERVVKLKQELAEERDWLSKKQREQRAAEVVRAGIIKRVEEADQELNELRLTLATEQQRYENLMAQRQPMIAREAELAEVIVARRAEIAGFENRLTRQADESTTAAAGIERLNAKKAEQEAAVATLSEERVRRSSATTDIESELRDVRNSLNDLHDLRSKQHVRQTQSQIRIDNLVEHVARRYQIDLRQFAPDQMAFEKTLQAQLKRRIDRSAGNGNSNEAPSNSVLEAENTGNLRIAESDLGNLIADLTRQLDNMGPVNLDAVHEYDELEERYKFLEAQNNDLTNSRRELLDVIARINSTTKKLFTETFVQVRTNFREMFAELFGGGRADLSLMDENDPLNCGIEITAKPPGKQLQSISLLSGGERAMVAVALLFAIYMVRPSPFCVLDEIDAPLDESNINRFIRILERFVEQSQFIIITHNKRTIAKADVLYGVTMEERGVSKLVGMKLAAPRQVAAESGSNGNGHSEATAQRHFALATR